MWKKKNPVDLLDFSTMYIVILHLAAMKSEIRHSSVDTELLTR